MLTRFDHEARIAVMQAADEARTLGHPEVGPGHLLIGLLADLRGSTHALLTRHGLTLESVRAAVVEHSYETEAQGPRVSPRLLDRVYEQDREALAAISIDLDIVQRAVADNFGEDLTAEWGVRRSRRGRRPGRGAPEGGPRGHRHGRPHGGRGRGRGPWGAEDATAEDVNPEGGPRGRGRRGPQSRRGDRPWFSASLREALRSTRLAAQDRTEPMSAVLLLQAILGIDDPAMTAALAGIATEALLADVAELGNA